MIIDRINQLENLIGVCLIDPKLASRRNEKLDEANISSKFGMALQQQLVGSKAANDVLAGFRAVHADDRLLLHERSQARLVLLDLGRARVFLETSGVDRDWVGSDAGGASAVRHQVPTVVDIDSIEQSLTAVEKVSCIADRLKTNDV